MAVITAQEKYLDLPAGLTDLTAKEGATRGAALLFGE
jgi:hypothetical protein